MRLALYQPDIAPNVGAMMRLCACFNIGLDIIEPCGFVFDDRKLRRAGMDYIEHLECARHTSWDAFRQHTVKQRLVLLTTKAELPHYDFNFRPDDILMMGRESAGVPDDVHNAADARIRIPMAPGTRSLNVALAASIALAEGLRQTSQFPAAV